MTKIVATIPFGNKPNANGRIYPKEIVKKMVEDINTNNYVLTTTQEYFNPEDILSNSEKIGETESASYIESENRLELTLHVSDDASKLFESKLLKVVPNGVGEINPDTKEVYNYKLSHFSITCKSAFKSHQE